MPAAGATQAYSRIWWNRQILLAGIMLDFNSTEKQRTANRVLPQLAVTFKIEAECSYKTFVHVDSKLLRKLPECKA
jgi:hypothetical protein